MSNSEANESSEGIAIIGMSGRFPGAKNIDEFWQNLRNGVESISFFSDQELKSAGVDPAILNNSDYVKAGGVLEGIELFDARFFGYSARDAEIMDPQHRLFLECAWESLENAGYNPEVYPGLIGVYAGTAMSTYLFNLYSNSERLGSVDHFQILLGNDKDYLATQVSYKLNLRGPSVSVQTACSTSLVAVCMACQSLLAYQCDIALAGGVAVNVPQKKGYFYQRGGINSPDGHCRAFDAAAQGTVGSNGLGIIVLRRLADALADGDCIHAIIKGTAINNDGSLKVGFTAPSVDGQAEVIAMAHADANVEPESISYIEAHGTATPLGDPIEFAALTQVFQANSSRTGFCAIGSVKTNIGHLDPAAGVTGLIKTVLALEHKLLPPSLHFKKPNPQINFANSPFYVSTALTEWKTGRTPRRAGVSSFGIGGTNAHVVLEEAPDGEASESSRPWQLLVLSAKTDSALETATNNLVEYLKQHSDLNLADVAYTSQIGRKAFSHRRMVLCRNFDLKDALNALETRDPERVSTFSGEDRYRPVVFMFSGQGTQYVNMALELYQLEPVFREQVDVCADLLMPQLGLDLRQVLFPSPECVEQASQQLRQTALAQPALFVIEYALAKLWIAWGIYPQAMIGHSIGEFVAACLAGVFSLEDALRLVAARSQLMEQMPSGAMTAVPLSEQHVQPFLGGKLSLAAVNAPSLCVVSGPTDAVDRLEAQLAERGLNCSRLHTSHAFHSEMMEPIMEAFVEKVRLVNLSSPQIPYVSNVTGNWVTAETAVIPSYWGRHLRQPVRFADGVEELLKYPDCILLEVGPGLTLSTLARQHPKKASDQMVLSSLPPAQNRQSHMASLLSTLGRLWLSGVQVNWAGFHAHERRRRIPLPTYPFERERYWIDPKQEDLPSSGLTLLAKKQDIADWFYVPSWKLVPPLALFKQRDLKAHPSRWLVFCDECGLGSQLVNQLEGLRQDVITVRAGDQFTHDSHHSYTINPRQPDDYSTLLGRLDKVPEIIVHLWSVTPSNRAQLGSESVEQFQDLGFYSLLFLAQAVSGQNVTTPVQIGVVSNQMQAVTGDEVLYPGKATVLGPCKVIPQEYPNITCRSIDVIFPEANAGAEERLIDQLIAELTSEQLDSVVAYRRNRRCVQSYEAVSLAEVVGETTRLRKGGVYLITGGLGGIGLVLAEHLAQTVQAKLILTGRTSLPERDHWEQWLVTHGDEDTLSRKIQRLQGLEQLGAQVMAASADVADPEQMQQVIQQALARFGEIHGVIHCAGVAGGGMIQLKTWAVAASVLAPKVSGVLILDDLFKNVPLDFFVICSSLASILGGFGQVDYCAANAFLDAFAHCHAGRGDRLTLSINWDTWQEVGMAVNTAVPRELAEWREESLRKGILPREGVDAFSRALGTTLPQVAISTKDLQTLIESINVPVALGSQEELEQGSLSGPRHSRPALATPYEAARNEVERIIADIWQELLGIDQVGIHDNFFELGGHSLLAIQLNSRLRGAFKVEMSVRQVFDAPTVAELATCIDTTMSDVEKIAKLLERIEHLSQEEVKSLLSGNASVIGGQTSQL